MFCIDVHHHFFSPDLEERKKTANAQLGWKTPDGNLNWTPELSLRLMDASNIDISILSFPAIGTGEKYPSRFGFFASLPFLDDIQGCLTEISYAFDELKADGISLPSHCGEGPTAAYIGEERYIDIWQELDRRRAVVFLHGTQTPSSTPFPHPFLGIPITEVANETFKAAAHLVVTGRKRQFPNVKIILSHMGGTMPMLAPRVAVLSNYMGCERSPEDILEDFKNFYFETALSSYGPNLQSIESFAPIDQLLFGTDLPAVDIKSAGWFTHRLKEHYARDPVKLKKVMHENALKLFPTKAPCPQLTLN